MRKRIWIGMFFYAFWAVSCGPSVHFIATSDPHFNGTEENYQVNCMAVDTMNQLKDFGPDFVWVLGDLTDGAKEKEWQQYTEVYGLRGEKRLRYPVMECFGNHDGNIDGIVRKGIQARNKSRAFKIHTDSLGLHYSWDIKGVHFVNLNLYPADGWDPTCEWCKYFKESFREAQNSLTFLEQDLHEQVGRSKRPVVLAFHLGYDDFSKLWWTESDRKAFYEVIKDYNIIAIFHGHNHAVIHQQWRNIPIWSVGSPQSGKKLGTFLLVKVNRKGECQVKPYQ